MRTVTVQARDGEQWQVRVQWLPRWRFLARRFGGWRRSRKQDRITAGDVANGIPDGPSGGHGGGGFFDSLADDIAIAITVIVLFVVFGLVFWFVLLPVLLLVVDLLAVVVLCVVAGVARVLFRRPWTVEAQSAHPVTGAERRFTAAVVGWRAALRTRDEIADKLRQGYPVESVVATTNARWLGPGPARPASAR